MVPTQKWEHIESPLDAFSTYTIAQSPHDPSFMLAGTHPARLYRSRNGGRTWDKLAIDLPAECELIGETRITSILFDSADAGTDLVRCRDRRGLSLAGRREHLAEDLCMGWCPKTSMPSRSSGTTAGASCSWPPTAAWT